MPISGFYPVYFPAIKPGDTMRQFLNRKCGKKRRG
jgi:hypothetical protein